MFGNKEQENKVVKVKVNQLFGRAQVRDTVTGKIFTKDAWVEIESEVWDRLKENNFTLNGENHSLLVLNEEVAEEQDNDASDDYVDDSDIEDDAFNGSVLQDTEVEEE